MKIFLFLFGLSSFALAMSEDQRLGNALKEGHLDPTVEEARMPGTGEKIDSVNTSPNPVPQAEEYEFNEGLIDGDYVQGQEVPRAEKSKEAKGRDDELAE